MKAFFQALQFFPYVLSSVVAVEQAVGKTAPGTSKKQIVLASVQAAAKLGEAVPDPEVAMVSGLIDSVVESLNASGVFAH